MSRLKERQMRIKNRAAFKKRIKNLRVSVNKIYEYVEDKENREVQRRYDCAMYSHCLNSAAEQDRAVPCEVCGMYAPKEIIYTDADIAGSMALLKVLYDKNFTDGRNESALGTEHIPRIKSMLQSGFTQTAIAERFRVSNRVIQCFIKKHKSEFQKTG